MPPRLVSAAIHRDSIAVPFHRHGCHELVLVLTGRLATRIGEFETEGLPGLVHVVPAGSAHDQRCRGAWRTCCVLYEGGEELLAPVPATLAAGAAAPGAAWMQHLAELHREGAAEAVAADLLAALLRWLAARGERGAERAAEHPGLLAALDWIEANPRAELSVAALAAAAGLRASRLSALFQARFACGPVAYGHRRRLALARRLLADPYLPVAEVARRCGYADPAYFARRFRAAFGQAPRQAR
jgi:AraC-like DNA-binding protein